MGLTGGCLCGGIRFEAARAAWCAHCHCTLCRRAHGAPLVTWIGVKRPDFRLLAGEALVETFRSSPAAVRRFCRRCGTMLFFEGERWPSEVHIARALVEGEVPAPSAHVFWDERVSWRHVDDELPRRGGEAGTSPL